ncbi:MAG: 3D domain-containing protein [Negativicutes bacterium]|nr:3D domain-containing protein [Negativicutes bacterium]
MKRRRHRTIKRLRKRYKHLAAAVAGAAILSGAMLPGVPPAIAHASADPNAAVPQKEAVTQRVGDTSMKALTTTKLASNAPDNFIKELDVVATAYAPGPHDNDQWGNKTYLGTQIRPGVIAVDPKVIPLGSRVFIQYPDGHGEYAIAEDTGGAIKGNRIDIAKWSVEEAKDFGMQRVKVFIVSSPTRV